MSILNYRGYQGSVCFENGSLIIQILHIDDTVVDECKSAEDAQSLFEDMVEDYLETCAAMGKEPNKPFKGSFNVRTSPAVHKKVAMLATSEGVSLNAWVIAAIEDKISRNTVSAIAEALRARGARLLHEKSPQWMGRQHEPTEPPDLPENVPVKILTEVRKIGLH